MIINERFTNIMKCTPILYRLKLTLISENNVYIKGLMVFPLY